MTSSRKRLIGFLLNFSLEMNLKLKRLMSGAKRSWRWRFFGNSFEKYQAEMRSQFEKYQAEMSNLHAEISRLSAKVASLTSRPAEVSPPPQEKIFKSKTVFPLDSFNINSVARFIRKGIIGKIQPSGPKTHRYVLIEGRKEYLPDFGGTNYSGSYCSCDGE